MTASSRPPDALRVVVVDNDLDQLRIACSLLENLGCDVRSCDNGADCLVLLGEFSPQLVLLDLAMPRMSGLDVCKIIRAEYNSPPPLLVAVTGYGTAEMHDRCTAAGFDRVQLKPIGFNELRELVDAARGNEP